MDAKSLLRAKKASARIEHPYAAYSAAGQLRCSICAVPVKQWDAHLLTKAHRQSVAREKKEAARLAESKKRAAPAVDEPTSKRAKVEDEDARSALPAGFFSAGNAPPPSPPENEDDDPEPSYKDGEGEGDAELDAFLASLDDDAEPAPAPTAVSQAKKRRTYKTNEEEEGVASYSAPAQLVGEEKEEEAPEEPEESEAERRERLAREEREEVLARLEEEQRAQEDADARVDALKARMEALRKKREARGEAAVPKGKKSAAAKAMAKAAAKK